MYPHNKKYGKSLVLFVSTNQLIVNITAIKVRKYLMLNSVVIKSYFLCSYTFSQLEHKVVSVSRSGSFPYLYAILTVLIS